MKYKFRTQLSAGFAFIVLITVALISLASNILINRQFEKYVINQQKIFAGRLADGLAEQYSMETEGWNLDYIHGFGMYALNDGYIIQLYDRNHTIVWDAENHDMTFCHQIMSDIQTRLLQQQLDGELVTDHYELKQADSQIGYADISYYSPYYSSENEFQFVRSLNWILLVVGGVSVVGAVAAGMLLAKRIATPIAKATELAREISEGNYSIRFESKVGTEELTELKQSVNQMAKALQDQEAIRQRMTTDVAHELRTPIANVSAHLEAVIEGVWEATPERLQRCYDEMNRISELISDLEELSRIEDENLKLQFETVDLLELANSVKATFEPGIKEKQISCTVAGESAIVSGDRKRLYQVIYNLLSNAMKYTPEGGSIQIRVKNQTDTAILKVQDTGVGISERELPFIFERFYRADSSRNRKTGGSGIGLSIAKAIIQAHGGKVSAESEIGRGSTFMVSVPCENNLTHR